MSPRSPLNRLLLALALFSTSVAALAAAPASTRRVVLEPTPTGFRWKLTEAQLPPIGDRQVLMHVRAVGLNRGEVDGLAKEYGRAGLVPASDAAGDVIAVGKSVREFKVGERVTTLYFRNLIDGVASRETLQGAHGAAIDGVLAEYLVIDDTAIAHAPRGLSYEEAATLPTAGLTAWMATVGQNALEKDDVVLVQGTGGVSMFALQFAAASGARVIATSSSDEKLARAKQLGARDGINYKTNPQWSKQVLELTNKHGADVVVDVGGKSTLEQSVQSLAHGGVLSLVGGLTGYDGAVPAAQLILRTARAQGVYVGSRADYERMSRFIEQHKIRPAIDGVYPLAEHETALKRLESGAFVGKIVLTL